MIAVRLPSGREVMLPTTSPLGTGDDLGLENDAYKDVSFNIDFADLVDVATEIGILLRKGVEQIVPTKASVSLTIGVDARTGKLTAFFVDGGVNGALSISLEWSHPREHVHDR